MALATLIACVVILAANPLRWPAATIEASLLEVTPVGSSTIEVLRALEKKGLFARLLSSGVNRPKPGAPGHVVGVKSMNVPLGEYRSPFLTSVSALLAFDSSGKLVDVCVVKNVGTP